jgi:hypothetical protein
MDQNRPKPQNYLVFAILTTVLCCLPAGVVSIVYAAKVNGLYAEGKYDEAESASKNAKTWAIVSAVLALIVFVLYFIFGAALIASGEF